LEFKSSTDIPVCDSSASSQGQTCIPNSATDRNVCATSGKVFINSTQYFDNVPAISWNFYIGGYQPAQKWLKDRKTRTLSYDDIIHYQKIIVTLKRSAEVMEEINDIRKF
jgi:hypothetical protein